jgi:hypothetical protein
VPPPAETGETLTFGAYVWRVIDKNDNMTLIITDEVIEFRPYHDVFDFVTWEQSDLRTWLNGEFYMSFSETDRGRIRETNIENKNNPWYYAEYEGSEWAPRGGNDTRDRIFLLSIEEALRYFGNGGQLPAPSPEMYVTGGFSDAYDRARVAYSARPTPWGAPEGTPCTWWLRSPGGNADYAAIVYGDGDVQVYGDGVYRGGRGVRPAMWIIGG